MAEQHLESGAFRRHRHTAGYAAIVVSGGYVEIGDTGRWEVGPGDVIYHGPYEAHFNVVSTSASVVNVSLPFLLNVPPVFSVGNTDDLLKAVGVDPQAVQAMLHPDDVRQPVIADWPDLLAQDLRRGPIKLGEWAARHGMCPETVSRGFRKAYTTTAARYRLEAQTRAALKAIIADDDALADIAFRFHFSDQAHMSRAIGALTGHSPTAWRKVKTVQASTVRHW